MHVAMQMFHNKLVDYMRAIRNPRAAVFESARRLARWHYQWMVIHEFLPAIVGTGHGRLGVQGIRRGADHQHQVLQADEPRGARRSSRSSSRWPRTASATASPGPATPSGTIVNRRPASHARPVSSVPLFEATPSDNNLNGSPRAVPPRLKIQWSKFFNDPGVTPTRTARPVRQFDASLADPLFQYARDGAARHQLLEHCSRSGTSCEGRKMGLPSGQQVARLMGVTPLTQRPAVAEPPHRDAMSPSSEQGAGEAPQERRFREYNEPNPKLAEALDQAGMGRRGPAVVLHPEGGRARRPRSDAGPCRRADCGRGPRRPVAEGSQLVSVPGADLEASAARGASYAGRFTMADLLKYAGVWS